MAEEEGEVETAPAPPAVVPDGPQDIILTDLRVSLSDPAPVDEEGNALELELTMVPGDPKRSSRLEASEEGLLRAMRVDAAYGDAVSLILRVVGRNRALFEAPLANLGIAGTLSGRLSGAELPASTAEGEEEDGPAGVGIASIACNWRLQRSLPPPNPRVRLTPWDPAKPRDRWTNRPPPLALRYTSNAHRDQFNERLDLWVQEMGEVSGVDPTTEEDDTFFRAEGAGRPPYFVYRSPSSWTHDWVQPPYIPHHMRGDPQTVATRNAYIAGAAEAKALFRAQAIQVGLDQLKDRLPTCSTAVEAVDALDAVHTYLETADHLAQIDAAATLKSVKRLSLPFERLVRNVWEEGPEVAYDRSKAELEKVLMRELARRRTEKAGLEKSASQARMAASTGPRQGFGSAVLNETLASLHATEITHTKSVGGGRYGLLSFKGQPMATRTRTREFGS